MSKSRSLNRVILIGNLTRDPIIKTTANGVVVCTFGIATNSSWRDAQGGEKERAEFHNIVAWNKLAEVCAQILSVGMLVYLEGELRSRVTTDEAGNKKYRTEIKLNDMILLDAKGKAGVGVDKAQEMGTNAGEEDEVEEVPADITVEEQQDITTEETDLF